MLARLTAGIETARPSPWVFVMRNAGADRDRADVDIAIVDMPAFLAGIRRSAAGERGHAPLKRNLISPANRPRGWGWNKRGPLRIADVDKSPMHRSGWAAARWPFRLQGESIRSIPSRRRARPSR